MRADLYHADEAFFTGTAAEVTPIREIDDRMVGAGPGAGHEGDPGDVLRRGAGRDREVPFLAHPRERLAR